MDTDRFGGFAVGDRVKTPMGMVAVIKSFRRDGYIDAAYVGKPRVLAEVILNYKHVTKA